jgi:hypothetical protein
MRLSIALGLALAAPLFVLASSGCGSETGSGTTGSLPDADDGKVRPEGNGKPMSEAAACTSLTDAQAQRSTAMGCTTTGRVCPDFLRGQSAVQCVQYDDGAVQGCIQFYSEATTCDAVRKASEICVVATIADSAPKGCP